MLEESKEKTQKKQSLEILDSNLPVEHYRREKNFLRFENSLQERIRSI